MRIEGIFETREVFVDGKQLLPDASQKVYNHSPDGFNWGYGGSGPAQLALALCLLVFDKETALRSYQTFKWKVIARLHGGFLIDIDLKEWLEDIKKEYAI